MSWKPEVVVDRSGDWVSNALRFATLEEAQSYVHDLPMRWAMVRDIRVVESTDPANCSYIDGKIKAAA
jgi:hypothetical protein